MTGLRKRGASQRAREFPTRADARLLELIKQFRRDRIEFLYRELERLHHQSPEAGAADQEIAALVSRSWRIRNEVTELPARSIAAVRQKAWLALWELSEDGLEQKPESEDFAVGWSLARDVLGRTAL